MFSLSQNEMFNYLIAKIIYHMLLCTFELDK